VRKTENGICEICFFVNFKDSTRSKGGGFFGRFRSLRMTALLVDSRESQIPHSAFRFPKAGRRAAAPVAPSLATDFLSFSEKNWWRGTTKKALAFYLSENGVQKTENGICKIRFFLNLIFSALARRGILRSLSLPQNDGVACRFTRIANSALITPNAFSFQFSAFRFPNALRIKTPRLSLDSKRPSNLTFLTRLHL